MQNMERRDEQSSLMIGFMSHLIACATRYIISYHNNKKREKANILLPLPQSTMPCTFTYIAKLVFGTALKPPYDQSTPPTCGRVEEFHKFLNWSWFPILTVRVLLIFHVLRFYDIGFYYTASYCPMALFCFPL